MTCLAALPNFGSLSFNYIDGIVAVWLIIGIILGRKGGMTQQLLPCLKWIAIAAVAGLFYGPLASIIYKSTTGAVTQLWSKVIAYVIIALAINMVFIWIKAAIGEKLTGSDYFGGYEYYLGMLAGLIRFACIFIVLCAIMHVRVYTLADLAEDEKEQRKNFEDIRFPTYSSVQYAILRESFTGRSIDQYLHPILISSTNPEAAHAETPASKSQSQIDSIIGPPKK